MNHEVPAATLTVHIVDDDEAVRRSLAMLLTSAGWTTATHVSAEAFLTVAAGAGQGCVLADFRMPGKDGLALHEELSRTAPHLPVVIMTGHADVGLAVRAMKAGVIDFIEKPFAEDDLLRAITGALARVRNVQAIEAQSAAAIARIAGLTPRERDVLGGLMEGRPNKVIAHMLAISPRTVEIHRSNMMDKLGCRSLAEAVKLALAAGFSGRP